MTSQREAENSVAVWGAVTFGALLASYAVLRPVRDAFALDENIEHIPWLFTGTFVAMLIVSPAWSALIARFGRRRLVPYAFHGFAACAIGFAVLVALDLDSAIVGRAFYVWTSVYSMFVVSVFWSLLADLVGTDAARRLFGPIAAGGTVGTVAGPALARTIATTLGVGGMLVVSAGLLELAVLGVMQVRRAGERIARPEEPASAAPAGNAFAGFVQVARSPYLRALAGYVLCTATLATFLYFEQAALAKAEFSTRDERAAFLAFVDLCTSLGTLVLQTFVAGWLLRRIGPGLVLAILPLAQLAGVSGVVLAPSLFVLVFAVAASRSMTHGLTRPARELLFTVVDRDEKYHAKNAIDTIGYRLGDVASAWLYIGLAGLGAGGIPIVIAAAPVVGLWLLCSGALGFGFRRRLSTKDKP